MTRIEKTQPNRKGQFNQSWLKTFFVMLFAAVFVSCGLSSCSSQPDVDLGKRDQVIDKNDKQTSMSVAAQETPQSGQKTLRAVVTRRYRHTEFMKPAQNYEVDSTQLADSVNLPNDPCWMSWVDGKLYRFDSGRKESIAIDKPTVDETNSPAREGKIQQNDDLISALTKVSAPQDGVCANGQKRKLAVERVFVNSERYLNRKYKVRGQEIADLVSEVNAYMSWIDGELYKISKSGESIVMLDSKPVIDDLASSRLAKISDLDSMSSREVLPGDTGFFGAYRQVRIVSYFKHSERYIVRRYKLTTDMRADLVAEQNAWLFWFDGDLYRIDKQDLVTRLPAKPVITLGALRFTRSYNDVLTNTEVLPIELTKDGKSIEVLIRDHYRSEEKYQVVLYQIADDTKIAKYNKTYKVWTVVVHGKLYAISFDDEDVVRPDDAPPVIVVPAPPKMEKPKVVVVPGPESDDSKVVVPGNPKNDNDSDVPVVVPDVPSNSPSLVIPDAPGTRTRKPARRSSAPATVIPATPGN